MKEKGFLVYCAIWIDKEDPEAPAGYPLTPLDCCANVLSDALDHNEALCTCLPIG